VAGGLLGTGMRLTIDTLIPHTEAGFPVATLLINVVGAFVLGVLVARVWNRAPAWARAGLGAGLLGSFTTFSALAVSLVAMADASKWMLAAIYLVASVVLGLIAAFAGLRLGAARRGRSPSRAAPGTAIDLERE
jgi:fluoride exporter